MDYQHRSVLLNEVIENIQPQKNQNFIDCTLGGGGYTEALLAKNGPHGKVLAFELDDRAIKHVTEKLKKYKDRLIVVNNNFAHLKEAVEKNRSKIDKISGIVFDLGLSSDQLDQAKRGFSFRDEADLDMRFDTKHQTITASDIILTYPEKQIEKILREYGEEVKAKKIAAGLVSWRQQDKQKQKLVKTSMLVSTILRILNIKEKDLPRFKRHPLTKVFQALRLEVNQELVNLQLALPQAVDILAPGGHLAVVSFHSLEDRIVKNYLKEQTGQCQCPPDSPICTCDNPAVLQIVTKKAIKPSAEEIKANPRSRSALLRVAKKL
ncbi:MAG: Ribosomal small subunit methyltransferase [Patescibacteria group bacterium]|nr:Ribosomal small subunit methyltransferase [Patescibacteria group bacterium]MDQ5970970.1 Ribosomal small subunit methyltransferase [Patescibacteria group bacterium]